MIAIYAFLPAVALSAMPVENGETALAGEFAGDPILGVVENIDLGSLQGAAEIYVGILAATILFIATNAGLIGVSRLTYSMGQYRQLPEAVRRLHPRFRTPYVAIIVFGVVACVTIIAGPGGVPRHRLRVRRDAVVHDRAPRRDTAAVEPSRTASGRVAARETCASRGRDLPLFAIVGGVRDGLAWIVVTVLNLETLVFGSIWLAIGIDELRRLPAAARA